MNGILLFLLNREIKYLRIKKSKTEHKKTRVICNESRDMKWNVCKNRFQVFKEHYIFVLRGFN